MVAPPIVTGTDFSQWQTWTPVTDPTGNNTYYEVPGYGGKYVYDPYTSAATGKYTIYENPKPFYDAAEAKKKQDEKATGLTAQLAVPAGALATTLGASAIKDYFAGDKASKVVKAGATGLAEAVPSSAAPKIVSAARPGATGSAAASESFLGGLASGDPLAGTASGALPYAGAALGAYGLYDLATDPKKNPLSGAAQGAASGAAIGSVIPGAGTVIGAGIGGVIGLASSLFGYHESGREKMQKRIDKLKKDGVNLPEFVVGNPQNYGLSKEELVAREEQKVAQGLPGNPKFAASRDEKDLLPTDTVGGLMWFEKLGNDYLGKATEEQRMQMNQMALDAGIINEARGQLSFTDEKKAQSIINQVLYGKEDEEEKASDELAAMMDGRTPLGAGAQPQILPIPRGG